jgi:hypothetical protein
LLCGHAWVLSRRTRITSTDTMLVVKKDNIGEDDLDKSIMMEML